MPRRLGELGCDVAEARERMERLFKMGLSSIAEDEDIPLTPKARTFIRDMKGALSNELFQFTYGQVTYAQDLYDQFCL
jgi:DNA invertase Pin-like site-specific DNA recombinase